jgi:hypothetical protein
MNLNILLSQIQYCNSIEALDFRVMYGNSLDFIYSVLALFLSEIFLYLSLGISIYTVWGTEHRSVKLAIVELTESLRIVPIIWLQKNKSPIRYFHQIGICYSV